MDLNLVVAVLTWCAPKLPVVVGAYIVAYAQGKRSLFNILRRDLNSKGAHVPKLPRWASSSAMGSSIVSAAASWAEDMGEGQEFEVGKVYRIQALDAVLSSAPGRLSFQSIELYIDGHAYIPAVGRPISLPGGHTIVVLSLPPKLSEGQKTSTQKFRAAFRAHSTTWNGSKPQEANT